MKRMFVLLLAGATLAFGDTEWREFHNSDKTKSFSGRLVGYDSDKGIVTVQRKSNFKPIRFKLSLLSDENQKFVKERALELEAASGLRLMFYENVKKVDSKKSGDTRTTSYDGGYKIELRNFARKRMEDVRVEWIAIYKKDSVDGPGSIAMKQGTEVITTLVPNLNENIEVSGIPLKSYRKSASTRATGGST